MLHGVHRRAPEEDTAVSLLVACHQRIRHFTSLAGRLAEASDAPARDVADAAQRIHRYFSIAFPLHVEDEEQSLLPRLRGAAPEVLQALEAMQREHSDHEAAVASLLLVTQALMAAPASLPQRAAELRGVAERLTGLFEPHLTREETILFPAALRLLDRDAHAAACAEYRARRVDRGIVAVS